MHGSEHEPPTPPDPTPVPARPILAPAADDPPPLPTARLIPAGAWRPTDPIANLKIDRPRGEVGLDFFLVAVLGVVIPYVPTALSFFSASGAMESSPEMISFAVIMQWVMLVSSMTLCVYLMARNGYTRLQFGLSIDDLPKQIVLSLGALVAIAAWMGVFLVGLALVTHGGDPHWLEEQAKERERFTEMLPLGSTLMTVLLLIPVAVHEELLFRGLLLPLGRRVLGSWTAAIAFSAGLFAVLHITQGWLAVPQIFGLAVIFSLTFLLGRSLVPVILAHFLFDFGMFQLMHFAASQSDSESATSQAAALLHAGAVLLGWAGWR